MATGAGLVPPLLLEDVGVGGVVGAVVGVGGVVGAVVGVGGVVGAVVGVGAGAF